MTVKRLGKSNNNNLERENTKVAKCKEVMNLVGKYAVYFHNSCNVSISLNFLIKKFFLAGQRNTRKLERKPKF